MSIAKLSQVFVQGVEASKMATQQAQHDMDATGRKKHLCDNEKWRIMGYAGLGVTESDQIPEFWNNLLGERNKAGRKKVLGKALMEASQHLDCLTIHVSSELVEDIYKMDFGDTTMDQHLDAHRGLCLMALASPPVADTRTRQREEDAYDQATFITLEDVKQSMR